MGFQKDVFVKDNQGRISLILSIDTPDPHISDQDMGRYTLQFVDGSILSNAPGYLLKPASDQEIIRAMNEHRRKRG